MAPLADGYRRPMHTPPIDISKLDKTNSLMAVDVEMPRQGREALQGSRSAKTVDMRRSLSSDGDAGVFFFSLNSGQIIVIVMNQKLIGQRNICPQCLGNM